MSRRALAEKRPLLLASIAAALAFYYLRWGPFPELYLIPLGVYLRNRRPDLTRSQKGAVEAKLLLTPLIARALPADPRQAPNVALYALALGAMAAGAWASVFPRYRVGAGAVLFLLSDLLLFAEMGPLQGHIVPRVLVWPLYYLGQLLIAVGVAQTLRKRDPELRIVVNN